MRSNDFSLFALFTAGLSAVVSAYTTPVGDTPTGNPISKPGLGEIVPVGTPYAITWDPTTTGTVTLLLLRGPSTNVVPLYPIVEEIPNTGSYEWTPKSDLEPDVTHYGIQLIVDSTGAYQYTTQFGISNPSYSGSSSSSSSSSSTPAGYPTSTPSPYPTSTPSAYTPPTNYTSVGPVYNSTTLAPYTPTVTHIASTGYPIANSSIVYPSHSMTVPTSLLTYATPTVAAPTAGSSAIPTGAAGKVGMSIGGAVFGLAVAVFAF